MTESIQDQIVEMAGGAPVRSAPSLLAALKALGLAVRVEQGFLRLVEPLELLDAQKIRELMVSGAACEPVICWQIDSTNTWLMARAAQPDFHGTVCLAEQQLAGRGRRGRHWVSPFGKNIYLSIGQRLPGAASALSGLSLVVGICVVRVLRGLGLQSVGLKWPNDVLLGTGKLAGILTEIASVNRDSARVVIGIGVNLRLDAADLGQIDQPSAVIADQLPCERNRLVAALLDELLPELEQFSQRGFSPYREEWAGFDVFSGCEIRLLGADRETLGINRGVDQQGNILVETAEGLEAFNAGEVSLRPRDKP
ncbi:MAG: biotin--[acetyl-CoA-carboxylase] ligase [Pseudomonadota bacterium]